MATLKKTITDTEKAPEVVDEEFTEHETQDQEKTKLRTAETDFIEGMLQAAEDRTEVTKLFEVIRNGHKYFEFHLHALSDEEARQCRKKYTKFVRNKAIGVKFEDSVDQAKFRSSLIYHATTEEDRENLWDNKKLWSGLQMKGYQIVTALDVIEAVLNGGEKDRALEMVNELSGYNTDDADEADLYREETAKK